ncbi:MAG: MraY family glycosyltransferase [Flavisolibacter sp.]
MSFAISFIAIPAIIRVAAEKKLFDLPDSRKLHTRPIASLGGVGIFLGFFLPSLLFISGRGTEDFRYFFVSSLIIFFLGLKDDILILSASKKFIGQLGAAAIVIHLGHLKIDSMHGLLGINTLPPIVSILLTYATIIVVINAYNLIDGVDGLAASLGIISSVFFGAYFFFVHMEAYAVFALTISGSLAAFLWYNFYPARIFMGDSGSLLLGLVNAILVIKFISVADSSHVNAPVASCVAVAVAILIVPLLDTVRVFSIRIAKGRSPFAPDRNHIHHLLLARGLSPRQVTWTCAGMNVLILVLAWFTRAIGPNFLLLSMSFFAFGLVGCIVVFSKPIAKSTNISPVRPRGGNSHTVLRKKEVSALEAVSENSN